MGERKYTDQEVARARAENQRIERIMADVQRQIDAGADPCPYCNRPRPGHTMACSSLRMKD